MTIVPVTAERLDALAIGDCIQCLGSHSNHTLERKFAALQAAGFRTTEFSFAEYFHWVRSRAQTKIPDVDPESFGNHPPQEGDQAAWETLYHYAGEMKALASKHSVEMRSLQCLGQVDTWPEGSEQERLGFAKAFHWIKLCHHLGLEFCQVGVNDQYEATGNFEKTVADLGYIADEAAKLNVKIAYESWNFAPRISQWEGTWDVVKAANRPNLGLCIDTAQCALAPQYGFDPTSGNGFTETAVQALLARLRSVPAEKIFFVEISDVLAPNPPLLLGSPFDEWHRQQGPGFRTGFTWCRCARVIPHIGRGTGKFASGEQGMGGGRTAEIVKAILETGFNGPMYFECFEVHEQEKAEVGVPEELAHAAALSWTRMREAMLAA